MTQTRNATLLIKCTRAFAAFVTFFALTVLTAQASERAPLAVCLPPQAAHPGCELSVLRENTHVLRYLLSRSIFGDETRMEAVLARFASPQQELERTELIRSYLDALNSQRDCEQALGQAQTSCVDAQSRFQSDQPALPLQVAFGFSEKFDSSGNSRCAPPRVASANIVLLGASNQPLAEFLNGTWTFVNAQTCQAGARATQRTTQRTWTLSGAGFASRSGQASQSVLQAMDWVGGTMVSQNQAIQHQIASGKASLRYERSSDGRTLDFIWTENARMRLDLVTGEWVSSTFLEESAFSSARCQTQTVPGAKPKFRPELPLKAGQTAVTQTLVKSG